MNHKEKEDFSDFMSKNVNLMTVTLIIICVLLLICCVLLSYMVFSYRNELNSFKKETVNETVIEKKNPTNEIINISSPSESIDITANPNNIKTIPVVPATVLENDSINDFTLYNSLNSKNYNKNIISTNREDNVFSTYASPKQTLETSSNINDYLTHSYSYSANLDKPNKFQYNHRKNKSLINNSSLVNNNSLLNNSHKRFPSIKKPRNLYERQSSISSTLGSVKSIIKRHYSIRSKNHSRNHSTSNSKIPSILIQNNIPLNFINEELDNKSSSLNEYCQSVTSSSVTDNNNNPKPKLNYLSSSSSKIKYDEDLPITDILIPPSSSYSYSSKTMLCNNSYENYNNIYNDVNNEEFINSVNNLELNNIYKENYNSNKIYHMAYNKKLDESIYSLSPFSNYSDNLSYVSKLVNEPENETDTDSQEDNLDEGYHRQELLNIPDTVKMSSNSVDISTLNIEYKKEE